MSFAHINSRTGMSFTRAYGTIAQVVARAKGLGHRAVGVADYLSCWGHIPLQVEAEKQGLKPIYGLQMPVCNFLDKDPRYDLVTLIAMNPKGRSELYRLLNVAEEQKFYRARLTWDQVQEIAKDRNLKVIIDEVHRDTAYRVSDDMLIALSPRPSLHLSLLEDRLAKQAIVAIAPVYPTPREKVGWEVLRKIGSIGKIGELEIGAGHMMAEKEIRLLFKNTEWEQFADAAFERVYDLVEKATYGSVKAVNVKPVDPFDIRERCLAGAKQRGLKMTPEYKARLTEEIDLIESKGFTDYFILVTNTIAWAKKHMLVGPGRGSVGGSLVAYLLGITEVDPIKHQTLFERFIDPSRSDWPDIDIDFPDVHREKVIAYLQETYGSDRVARVGTVSILGGKSAVNDCARALGIGWEAARTISAALGDEDTLAQGFEREDVKPLLQQYPALRNALLIEGQPRHTGVHAAGVCIADYPIADYVGVQGGVAQLTLGDAEAIGLMKLDALGLRTLSVINDCCAMAGIDPYELYALTMDDPEVFKIFQEDRLTGVFQFEGQAVRGLTRMMRVESFEDLSALTSLARPGPLVSGDAALWCRRRMGDQEWESIHPVLDKTFGTCVYQEQVMVLARDLAGFNGGEVNALRKAIGKKIPEKLIAMKGMFLEGCARIGKIDEDKARKLWDKFEEFGAYAFNLAHAAAYSMISYITAYLKAYYPNEFICAALRHAADDQQARHLLREHVIAGNKFIPFDPQRSEVSWSIKDGVLLGGFTAVTGVGLKTAQKLMEMREEHGEIYVDKLSQAVRKKLLVPNNTPWSNINQINRLYGQMYRDPDEYRSKMLPRGISGPIWFLKDIPLEKGSYTFVARIIKKTLVDQNAPDKVAKRGSKISGDSISLNLIFEDDTGEIGGTVSRFGYPDYGAAIWADPDAANKFYLVKAKIPDNNRSKWVFIDKILDITEDEVEV